MRIFVTGTDTGVGKTQAACALLSLMAREGLSPIPFKPYESGCEDLSRPADALALVKASGTRLALDRISLHRFEAPLAPGMASDRPTFEFTLRAFQTLGEGPMVVEGAGGLRVPIDGDHEVADLIGAMKLPVLLVARAGLGTLNHTALTLEALQARDISVAAVLLSHTQEFPDLSSQHNADWLRRKHRIRIFGPVPYEADPTLRASAFEKALAPLLAEFHSSS